MQTYNNKTIRSARFQTNRFSRDERLEERSIPAGCLIGRDLDPSLGGLPNHAVPKRSSDFDVTGPDKERDCFAKINAQVDVRILVQEDGCFAVRTIKGSVTLLCGFSANWSVMIRDAAYCETLRRLKNADPHARFAKLEHQLQVAYSYAGQHCSGYNRTDYPPPPLRPKFEPDRLAIFLTNWPAPIVI
jgi:hypothetical protein